MSAILDEERGQHPGEVVVGQSARRHVEEQLRAERAASLRAGPAQRPPEERLAELWDLYFEEPRGSEAALWILGQIAAHQQTHGHWEASQRPRKIDKY